MITVVCQIMVCRICWIMFPFCGRRVFVGVVGRVDTKILSLPGVQVVLRCRRWNYNNPPQNLELGNPFSSYPGNLDQNNPSVSAMHFCGNDNGNQSVKMGILKIAGDLERNAFVY